MKEKKWKLMQEIKFEGKEGYFISKNADRIHAFAMCLILIAGILVGYKLNILF